MSHNYTPGHSKPRAQSAEILVTTTRPSGATSTRITRCWTHRLPHSLDPRLVSGVAERFANSKPCWERK